MMWAARSRAGSPGPHSPTQPNPTQNEADSMTLFNADEHEVFVNLLVAALCGAALGFEREIKRKPAGLRTNMLIGLGAALYTYASRKMVVAGGDPSRIAAQIVTGIGFLGAGTILQHGRSMVSGLTTAATVWVVAALGVAAGMGQYVVAFGGTMMAVMILVAVSILESWVGIKYRKYRLRMVTADRPGIFEEIQALFRAQKIELEHFTWHVRDHHLDVELIYQLPHGGRPELLEKLRVLEGVERVSDFTV